MPRGRPSVGREQYVRIKLRKHTHALWVEVKRAHAFKSDDALARHLLCSVSAATAAHMLHARVRITLLITHILHN